jgi:TfoX/Sxy family transcriptional regulator of competence genes
MAINENLANRIREKLIDIPDVEEKKMFSGMCFMVNGKMCVCVNDEEMLCRIGPQKMEWALEQEGCRPMIHNGRNMTGYVFVSEDVIKSKESFDNWMAMCLDFNKEAKASVKKKKKV